MFYFEIDLLEVCDPESIASVAAAEKQLKDDGGEFDEDLALIADEDHTNKDYENSEESDLEEDFGDEEEEEGEDSEDINDFEDEDSVDEEEEDLIKEEFEDTTKNEKSKNKKQKFETASENEDSERDEDEESENGENDSENAETEGTWTDIYGRLRGKDGSIIEESSEKYIPPAKRAQMAAGQSADKKAAEKLLRLQRQLKGVSLPRFFVILFVNTYFSRAYK